MSWLLPIRLALAVDIDSFRPSAGWADGRGGLQVPVADTGERGAVYVAGIGGWAHRPLMQDTDGPEDRPVVANLVTAHLLAGYTLTRGARLDVDVAFAPNVAAGGFEDGSSAFEGAAMGDLRLSALLTPVRLAAGRVGLGVLPSVRLPTGDADAWVGAGAVTGGATALVSARPLEALALSAAGGAEFSTEDPRSDVLAGNLWSWGFGLDLHVARGLRLGAELTGRRAMIDGDPGFAARPVEAHAYAGWNLGAGPWIQAFGGTGVVAGVRAPDVRAGGGLGFRWAGSSEPRRETVDLGDMPLAPPPPEPPAAAASPSPRPTAEVTAEAETGPETPAAAPRAAAPSRPRRLPRSVDQDRDGIADADDRCPAAAEDYNGRGDDDGCPDAHDQDLDSLPDAVDDCPTLAEDLDGYKDTDGCPDLDNDRDQVPDAQDGCPDEVGPAAAGGCPDRDKDGVADREDACLEDVGLPEDRGCPDRDGDHVPDIYDACPAVPSTGLAYPEWDDGCERAVYVDRERGLVHAPLQFEVAGPNLVAESRETVVDIARFLSEPRRLPNFLVLGHPTGAGTPEIERALAQARAEGVLKLLVGLGVPASRLSVVPGAVAADGGAPVTLVVAEAP